VDMDARILKEIIALIRKEQEQRPSLLCAEDQDYINDYWPHFDDRFLNELCLMFLVTLRHQIEREIIGLAARTADDGREISRFQYTERIGQLQLGGKTSRNLKWKEIEKRLGLNDCENYKYMQVLRLLANSYKHDFSTKPTEKLLKELAKELGPDPENNYAALQESDSLRKRLVKLLGLIDGAGYCDIAEGFVDIANNFLAEVKSLTVLSKVKSSGISLKPSDFEG